MVVHLKQPLLEALLEAQLNPFLHPIDHAFCLKHPKSRPSIGHEQGGEEAICSGNVVARFLFLRRG